LGDNPVFRHNILSNNTMSGIRAAPILVDSAGSAMIDYNVIVNNAADTDGASAIYLDDGISCTIRYNLIAGNAAAPVLFSDRVPFVLEHNTIIGNHPSKATVYIYEQGEDSKTLRGNNILRNSPAYDVFTNAGGAYACPDIDAIENYWGTTNAAAIDARIYDYYDDFNLPKVLYTPFLHMPDQEAPPFTMNVSVEPISPVGIGPITVTVDFSKPMSPTIQPTVTFGISPIYDTHIVAGDWVSTTRWVGNYDVTYYTGDGVQRLRVAGAVGANDEMQVPEDTSFTFEIATIGAANTNAEPGYGYVALSWTPSDLETVAGYNLYRATQSGGPYTRLNSTVIAATAYTDTNVINGTTYYYMVKLLTTDLYEMDYGSEMAATPNDYTPPIPPVVTDDGNCTPLTTTLHASWSASDPESGIAEYQYGIGTSPGARDVVNWISVGTCTEVTRTDLNLMYGVTYYFTVKARNGAGTWSTAGNSDGITVDSVCPTPTPTLTPTESQSILLSPGWNLVSFCVEPPLSRVDQVLNSIAGDYDRLLGEYGIHIPALPITYSTLSELHGGRGYYLRFTGSTSSTLLVDGERIPVTMPLALHNGWNWIGYLPETALPITEALQSIDGSYLRVLDLDATYDPALPEFSTLHEMCPGKGYLIRVTGPVTLTYPTGGGTASTGKQPERTAMYTGAAATPYFTLIYGRVTINGQPARTGTRVEVLTLQGNVAACFVVQNAGQYGLVHVYGKDETATPVIPGFRAGEPLRFRVNGNKAVHSTTVLWQDDKEPHMVNLDVEADQIFLPLLVREAH